MTNSRKQLLEKSPQLTVRVQNFHCVTACRKDSGHCMIADAIADSCRRWSASHIIVDAATIRITDLDKGRRYIYTTPPVAQNALLAFDEGAIVRPFTFKLKDGLVFESGWRGQKRTETATRTKKKPSKPGKYNRFAVTRYRQFGLRMMRSADATR